MSSLDMRRARWHRSRRLKGTSVLLCERAGANCYYHWMMDFMPRVGMIEFGGINLDDIGHFIVKKMDAQFQLETLQALGIDRSRIVVTGPTGYLRCDELHHINLENLVNMGMQQYVTD